MENLVLDTDSYKASHWLQYPPNSTGMYSYLESRGGRYDKTVFFGLQYVIKKYLSQKVTKEMVDEAEEFFKAHGEPFNREGWDYILNECGGLLPVTIKAVPEGLVVPTHNILASIECYDPKAFWVVSWIETMFMRLWYPITVATQSWHIKSDILGWLERTADDPQAEINFKLHDFGSRGVSSQESAAIGGAAHLVNFMGTDTVAGAYAANKFYNEKMAGFSIPAAEHSTITAWGQNKEMLAYKNMLDNFAKPGSLVAVVSDSYNLWYAVSEIWGNQLKKKVIESGATVVIRPDSGYPPEVVKKTLQLLGQKFGFTVNSKGYKVLNHVRVIQGDGINQDSINEILRTAVEDKWSASNIAFGMGGALLQQVNRDTQKFAFKCSAVKINGEIKPVSKNPVTDPGKKSKAGRLALVKDGNSYKTIRLAPDQDTVEGDLLTKVFENGKLLVETNLSDIRKLANDGRTE